MAVAQTFGERLILGPETSFGTPPGTPKAAKLPVMNPSIKLNVNRFRSEAVTGSAEPRPVTDGKFNVSGSYDLEASKDSLMYPLYGVLGTVADRGITGWYDHWLTFSAVDIPPFFFEQGHADISQYLLWKGCKHVSASMRVEMEGLMKSTFNVVGASQAISGASFVTGPNTRDDTGGQPFDYTKAVLKYDGSVISYLQTLTLDIDRGTTLIGAIDSSKNMFDAVGNVATVKGTARAYFEDATLISDAIASEEVSLEIWLADSETTGHGLWIYMPTVKFQPSSPTSGGGGAGIGVDFNFDAYARGSASDIAGQAMSKNFASVNAAGEAMNIKIDGDLTGQDKPLPTDATFTMADAVTSLGTVTGATVAIENGRLVIKSATKGVASKVNVSGPGGALLGFPTGDQVGFSARAIAMRLSNSIATLVQA